MRPVTIYEFWIFVTSDFIMGNIGKIVDSEMGMRKNGRSNLIPITYRTLIGLSIMNLIPITYLYL